MSLPWQLDSTSASAMDLLSEQPEITSTNFYFLTQTPGNRLAAVLSSCSSREGKQKQVLQTSPSQPSSLF